MSVAVVDGGGNLICFEHMDGAPLISTEISQAKAFTALAFKSNTESLAKYAEPGGACFGMETSVARPLAFWGGGAPLLTEDEVVGAVGAGGASPDQDAEVAQTAVGEFQRIS
jgi:uncharacterized protein GlcG (DUF336 family)